MDANNIYSGPAHSVSLWDSTNKQLLLGYIGANVEIEQRPLSHNLIDGNEKQYTLRTTLEAELLESNPERIGDLYNRQGIRQDVFIVVDDRVFKFSDVFVSFAQIRPVGPTGYHSILLTVQTEIQKNFETITNLLSSWAEGVHIGSMEDGSPPTYWDADTSIARGATFLASGGGTYCIELDQTAGDTAWSNWVELPLEAKSIKITASGYLQAGSGTISVDLGYQLGSNTPAVTSSEVAAKTITTSSSTRYSHSATITPASTQAKIRFYCEHNANGMIKIDNAQIQIGDLSAYTENEER